jgi:uncharacterized protein with beta-barrel porin domain
MNHDGFGLVGGILDDHAYAAHVTFSNNTPTPLFDTPFPGYINSVAINASGAGLIGGQNSGNFYAATIDPDGTLSPLFVVDTLGWIKSVAINDAGVGLIGGYHTGGGPYSALVAPNGALTLLDPAGGNTINSVDIANLTKAVPQSIGPYAGAMYTQLAASAALESRFIGRNPIWGQARDVENSDMNIASNNMDFALGPRHTVQQKVDPRCEPNSIWISPFGNYVRLEDQGKVPTYTNAIGGALLGYDYKFADFMVGAAIGYAFNSLDYSEDLGHGKLQEEIACFYSAYSSDRFRFGGALWGGVYQFWNVRHTLSLTTSEAETRGWILSPHVELATPWAIDCEERYFVEPFVMFDWVNSWQNDFTEMGAAGLNIEMESLYTSLLQSEVGLRFYERFAYGWGDFLLEEKVSYINQAPFNFHSVTTSFIAAASTFPIAVGSSKIENLGAIELFGSFVPKNRSYPFGGFSLQATANTSYQSYFASLFLGADF